LLPAVPDPVLTPAAVPGPAPRQDRPDDPSPSRSRFGADQDRRECTYGRSLYVRLELAQLAAGPTTRTLPDPQPTNPVEVMDMKLRVVHVRIPMTIRQEG